MALSYRFPIKFSLTFQFFIDSCQRNRHADPQILISDALQKQNHSLCRAAACDHCMSNGISALPDGYPNMPDLHRELLVQQLEGPFEVGGERSQHQPGIEASAVPSRVSSAPGRDRWLHAGKGRQLLAADCLLSIRETDW